MQQHSNLVILVNWQYRSVHRVFVPTASDTFREALEYFLHARGCLELPEWIVCSNTMDFWWFDEGGVRENYTMRLHASGLFYRGEWHDTIMAQFEHAQPATAEDEGQPVTKTAAHVLLLFTLDVPAGPKQGKRYQLLYVQGLEKYDPFPDMIREQSLTRQDALMLEGAYEDCGVVAYKKNPVVSPMVIKPSHVNAKLYMADGWITANADPAHVHYQWMTPFLGYFK